MNILRIIVFALAQSAATNLVWAQTSGSDFASLTRTRQIISSIIDEEKLSIPYWKLLSSVEWCDYVFSAERKIPHSADALEGTIEDCKRQPADFGNADITTMGWLLVRDRCMPFSRDECEAQMRRTLRHEARHYVQWQEIALRVLSELGVANPSKSAPQTLADLEGIPGARVAFVEVFENTAHYQCREVAVYGDLILDQTIKKGDPYYRRALSNMIGYYALQTPGCINIDLKYKSEFQPKVDAMWKLLLNALSSN